MDPYLEGSLWSGFHNELSTIIKLQLTPKLEPRYYAFTTRYFLWDAGDDLVIAAGSLSPDLGVVEGNNGAPVSGVGVATAAPVELRTALPHRVPHARIEIRDLDQRRLVTAIEFLSPTNKKGRGRDQYLRKRERILQSAAHLVEIELLRKGLRLPLLDPLPSAPYFLFVNRADNRLITEVWAIQLSQALSLLPIPLLPGDRDVMLDLQLALTTIYDAARFDRVIDYSQPPDVSLTEQEDAWADHLLRA